MIDPIHSNPPCYWDAAADLLDSSGPTASTHIPPLATQDPVLILCSPETLTPRNPVSKIAAAMPVPVFFGQKNFSHL
jgi:hypothetical protein